MLYVGRADNGSGHCVFKLDTKQPISINRITLIPMLADFIDRIKKWARKTMYLTESRQEMLKTT